MSLRVDLTRVGPCNQQRKLGMLQSVENLGGLHRALADTLTEGRRPLPRAQALRIGRKSESPRGIEIAQREPGRTLRVAGFQMSNRIRPQHLDFRTNVRLERTSEWRNQNLLDYGSFAASRAEGQIQRGSRKLVNG